MAPSTPSVEAGEVSWATPGAPTPRTLTPSVRQVKKRTQLVRIAFCPPLTFSRTLSLILDCRRVLGAEVLSATLQVARGLVNRATRQTCLGPQFGVGDPEFVLAAA